MANGAMGQMVFKMPWPPVGLSPNARNHWARVMRLKRKYRAECAWQAIVQGAKPIKADSLHLTITFFPPTRRDYDIDNAIARIKSGLDGLADVLRVDDKNWSLTLFKGEGVGGYVEIAIKES